MNNAYDQNLPYYEMSSLITNQNDFQTSHSTVTHPTSLRL